jgi:hypothetical protein
MGVLSHWYLKRGEGTFEDFYEPSNVIKEATKSGKTFIIEPFLKLQGELEKKTPNRRLMVELALDFPEFLARTDRKVLLIIDEFQELLALNAYKDVRDIEGLFRAVIQRQGGVSYIVSGSYIRLFEKMFGEGAEPLFLHFELKKLGYFSREDSYKLALKLLGPQDRRIIEEIFSLSHGHPFYIKLICGALKEFSSIHGFPLSVDMVRKAFVISSTSPEGGIYKHCSYLFEKSLAKVRGYGTIKAILFVLAREDGLTLAEIASRLGKKSGEINVLIKRAMDVDLLTRVEGRYCFRDPVLKYWLLHVHLGIEAPYLPKGKVIEDLVGMLQERYQRVSTELGLAKESEVREFIRNNFRGQVVDGKYFGMAGRVRLPDAKKVENIVEYDDKSKEVIEIDALVEDDESWLLEIKWKNTPAGIRDLKALLNKREFLKRRGMKIHQAWFISKTGFKDTARAEELGILTSDEENLKKLMRELK